MSTEQIGFEILPNTYISKISLHEGTNNSYYGRAHVYVRDQTQDDGRLVWSGDKNIMEKLKFMFMDVRASAYIGSITSGRYKLNDLMKLESRSEGRVRTQYRNVNNCKKIQKGNDIYYKTTFEFSINQYTADHAIFCCLVMDSSMASSGNPIIDKYTMNLKGPTTSEYIIQNFNLNTKSNIFTRPDGSQWHGPVHYHQSVGYMEGATHTDQAHGELRRRAINNLKIINHIDFLFKPKTTLRKPRNTPVTKLWHLFRSNGNLNGLFGINYKNILIRHTKYGHSLVNIDPADMVSLIQSIKVNKLAIKRNKVKVSMGAGVVPRRKINTKILESSDVISSFSDDFGTFKEAMIVDDGVDRMLFSDEIRTKAGLEVVDESRIYVEDLSSLKIKSNIKEVFFNINDNIRFYEFQDNTVDRTTYGDYTYHASLSFRDPTIDFVNNLLKEAKAGLSSLKNYLSRLLAHDNYDYDLDLIEQHFIDSELKRYKGSLDSAPWSKSVKNYSKYINFLFQVTEEQVDFLLNTSIPKVHPKTASIDSIKLFIKQYEQVLNKLYKQFDISVAKITSGRARQTARPLNSHPHTNIITLSFDFKNVVETKDNKLFYNFLPASPGSGIRSVLKQDLLQRLQYEQGRYSSRNLLTGLTAHSLQNGSDATMIRFPDWDNAYIRKLNKIFRNLTLITWNDIVITEEDAEVDIISEIPESVYEPAATYLDESSKFITSEDSDDRCNYNTWHTYREERIYPQQDSIVAYDDLSEVEKSQLVGSADLIIRAYVSYWTSHQIEVLDGFMSSERDSPITHLENWRSLSLDDLATQEGALLCRIRYVGPGWQSSPEERPLLHATMLPDTVNKYFFVISNLNDLNTEPKGPGKRSDKYNISILQSFDYNLDISTSNIIKQNITTDKKNMEPTLLENLNEMVDASDMVATGVNIIGSFAEPTPSQAPAATPTSISPTSMATPVASGGGY
tara:strand:+ start:15381 stop:18263 length:2883 start_codon:yes stop_codon:yes gene_type:complete